MHTPIYDMLKNYKDLDAIRMHMPGHKGKGEGDFSCISEIDVTEISATDDLYEAKGAIKEAQELAAKAYGAAYTQFLTNGSTAGVIAALTSFCGKGQTVIADRGSHRSLISACMISGADICYTEARLQKGGTMLPAKADEIEKLLCETNAKIVYITSPNYFGQTADVEKIAALSHEHGALLIVDQAHGAHFPFSDKLPKSACIQGADIVVCSAHKTLAALTQGAYLHINDLSLKDEVLFRLRAVQTSSPSFPIMASLDIARAKAEEDKDKYDEIIDHVMRIKEELLKSGIETLETDDPLKLVVDMSTRGGGFYAKERLEEKCIFPEMADLVYVCFIVTPCDTIEELDKLKDAIVNLKEINMIHQEDLPKLPCVPFEMSIREATCKKQIKKSLYKVIGKISARDIGVYPPGVPIIAPGQRITKEAVEYIDAIVSAGGTTFNVSGGVYVVE